MSYEHFIKDKKTLNAVVRSIEVIGEESGFSHFSEGLFWLAFIEQALEGV